MKIKFLACLTVLSLLSCANRDEDLTSSDMSNGPDDSGKKTGLDYIKYGSFFGMCQEDCNTTYFYDDDTFSKQVDNNKATEVIADEAFWNQISALIDFNEFKKFDETIGCPDCADGGGEWLELKKGEDIHKTTFEFGKSPESLKQLIDLLKNYKIE